MNPTNYRGRIVKVLSQGKHREYHGIFYRGNRFWAAESRGTESLPTVILDALVLHVAVLAVAARRRKEPSRSLLNAMFVLLPLMALACGLDHVGAPAAELITSAAGAWLLGWLALRARSVWPGLVMHLALAWSVDVGCCLRR